MIPEPFSITLSVFATLGFLNLARQGGQALLDDIETYRKTPADIARALTSIGIIDHRIESWKRVWLIESDTHAEYPIFLWGDGWEHIQNQIDIIEEVSRKIKTIIAPYIREWQVHRDFEESPMIQDQGTLGTAAVQRNLKQGKTPDHSLRCTRKLIHVLSESKKLKDYFMELPVLFDMLNRTCEDEFYQKHDVNRSMTNSARRNTATFEMLVSQALDSRHTSCVLYEQCLLDVEGAVELELSLLKSKAEDGVPRPFNAGIPNSLCFYLTIPSTTLNSIVILPSDVEEVPAAPLQDVDNPLEVLIEGTAKVPTEHKGSFREACLDLLQKQSCYFRHTANVDDAASKSMAFKLWISSDKVAESGRVESTLRDLLSNPAFSITDSEHNLSLRERIEIAYRIAECTLLLLETPWLSSLESSNITRAHAADLASRYRLLVRHHTGGRNDHEAQMLLVGQLLRELALGTNIGPFNRDRDLDLVSKEVGEKYQRALDFCYKPHHSVHSRNLSARDQELVKSQAALVDFFKEVFVPLAELHESSTALVSQNSFLGGNPNATLRFSPTTYTEQSRPELGDQIPYMLICPQPQRTLLGTRVQASMKALSIRSSSSLGHFGESDAIVYYVATQRFAKVAKENIPEGAHRLDIPSNGMTYELRLPSQQSPEGSLIATLSFKELGVSVTMRRLSGKINELYVVDELAGTL